MNNGIAIAVSLFLSLLLVGTSQAGTITFSGRDWTTREGTGLTGGNVGDGRGNPSYTSTATSGTALGAYGNQSGMWTALSVSVGNVITFDQFVTSDFSLDYMYDPPYIWIGDVSVRLIGNTGDIEYWNTETVLFVDSYSNPDRVLDLSYEFVFVSETEVEVTRTDHNNATNNAAWTATIASGISTIDAFYSAMWDSAQHNTISNFVHTQSYDVTPTPQDGAGYMSLDPELSWKGPVGPSIGYDVYFDSDRSLVNARDASVKVGANQAGTTYTPSPLEYVTTYYWRVDTLEGGAVVYESDVWEFTTRGRPFCLDGDLYFDCKVDLLDLAAFAAEWLSPAGSPADLVGDNGVDMADFGIIAGNWLEEVQLHVVINEIHYNPDVKVELVEFVELYNPSPFDVDISGWHFCDGITYEFPQGTILPAGGYIVVAEDPSLAYTPTTITDKYGVPEVLIYGPFEGSLDNEGEKIELCSGQGEEIDQVDYKLGFPWPTVGDGVPDYIPGTGHSIQLVNPGFDNDLGGHWRSAYPTPCQSNDIVYTDNAPSCIRQVQHSPQQPKAGEVVTVTAKVTDPDGIALVQLYYQLVSPGSYIRLTDSSYDQWASQSYLVLHDDGLDGDEFAGDDIYTVEIPANFHLNRWLLRYRIQIKDSLDNILWLPYDDDPQPNFAYFVYNGVPAWSGADRPGVTPVGTFSSEFLESIPVYHLIADATDVERCQYNRSYKNTRFRGTLIYDGQVYDHIEFNVRGEYSTYVTGKNKWRYRFHRGHHFQGRDNFGKKYKKRWNDMKVNGGATPWTSPNRGMAGIDECLSFRLFELAGVPTSRTNYFHFRVIDGTNEASLSSQYDGDMWGLYYCVEVPDTRFLSDRDLPDGNLYKLEYPIRQYNQGADEPVGPGDITDVRSLMSTSQTEQWWRDNVDHVSYGRYKAVAEAVTHYDQRDQSQGHYFHNPETGKWVMMPWDLDTMFQLTGKYYIWDRIRLAIDPGYPTLLLEAVNEQREILDLLFNATAVDTVMAELVNIVNPAEQTLTWADLDQCVWNYHPRTTSKGSFNLLTASGYPAGHAYTRTLISADHKGQMDYIRKFMQPGGWGYDKLVAEVADSSIPFKPSVIYTGPADNPINALTFRTSAFFDPQGAGTFAAMKWRIAEVEPGSQAATEPLTNPMIIKPTDTWRYFKGTEEPSAGDAWRLAGFNDDPASTDWLEGAGPIGYGVGSVATVLSDMRYNYTTVYLRYDFDLSDPAVIEGLTLSVDYDEGFNVWINGRHVAAVNVSGPEIAHDATAPGYVPGQTSTNIVLPDPNGYLVAGANVVAVQLCNNTIGSSDLLFSPTLTAQLADAGGSSSPVFLQNKPLKYEIDAAWESGELTVFDSDIRIPASLVKPGRTYRVRCRMKDDTGRWSHWSDPNQFVAGEPLSVGILDSLRITEMMYNPAEADTAGGELNVDDDEFEFIELKNIGDETLDLTYVSFSDGVTFSFENSSVTTLGPGEFVLVVTNRIAFESRYGDGLSNRIAGDYVDQKLSNSGETIKLTDLWNGTIAEFNYNDGRGWPISADGAGHSIIPLNSAVARQSDGSCKYGGNWRASMYIHGSPGANDPAPPTGVMINEIMAHTDYDNPAKPEYDSNDWIELYNTTGSAVTFDGHWYLSDDSDDLKRWAIPGITISAHGRVSFDEVSGFHNPITTGFGLNKMGEQVFLSYLPGATGVDRVVDYVKFKGQANLVSRGRLPDGGAYWFALTPTRDNPNAGAVGSVVINELMYHPADNEYEYVELYNPTAQTVNLYNSEGPWRLDGAVNYTFVALISIAPGQVIVVVPFDPENTADLNAFIDDYQPTATLQADVNIFGPFGGNLSNGSERLSLERRESPDLPDTDIPWVIVDEVIYADYDPWPVSPDGTGDALHRLSTDPAVAGNDPTNWHAESPTPGQ